MPKSTEKKPPVLLSVKDLRVSLKKKVNKGFRASILSLKKTNTMKVDAIKNISFDVKKGDKIGIVGRTGSGKSVLIKALAGVYEPDHGSISGNLDSVSYFNPGGVTNGFLTGADNIYAKGILLGFSEAEIRERLGKIIKFAGLGSLAKKTLMSYPNDAKRRLKFAMSAFFMRDIVLIDSGLSVGIGAFRKKSANYMEKKISEKRRTVIIVSGNLKFLYEHCNKVLWLEKGKIKKQGEAKKVIEAYKAYLEKLEA